MSAKAVLVAKINSNPFEDRVLLLDVPVKIGRSHKDDQAESGNGYFDCKVLSRQHSLLMYEDEKFYLLDLGSSNGTFVNNIRLSKGGEESKMTEIFTNDILRFGSDIVDKSRQVTQKCIIAKIRLFHADGAEVSIRPTESRLFRPNDEFEDMHAITQSLQESLTREKSLEDKLIKVKGMISKNIGRSQTDLMRAFEDIKQEIMSLEGSNSTSPRTTSAIDEIIATENASLTKKVQELGEQLGEQRTEITLLQDDQEDIMKEARMKEQTQNIEILTLKKACEMQKEDIEELTMENRKNMEYNKELIQKHQEDMLRIEEEFNDERTNLRERLHEVTSNEINLLNRIKSLEANDGYSRAEVDRCLTKEKESQEIQQRLQYRIECLETELDNANRVIEEQSAQVVIQRAPEDIELIQEQEQTIAKLQEDVNYIKQELIEARSHKAASDDELGNVKGQLETLQNNITSLSDEGNRLRKQISELEEICEAKTTESNHMKQLVAQMESAPGQEEQNKVQIADLKAELSKAEAQLEIRSEEILNLKKDLRLNDETIQQKDIDISCLRGQVQNVTDEMNNVKNNTSNVQAIKEENIALLERLESLQIESENYLKENEKISDELHRQQTLYGELKKMRGRGEEMDLIQQMEKESRDCQYRIQELETELDTAMTSLENLNEEKIRLLREVAQLKTSKGMPLESGNNFGFDSKGEDGLLSPDHHHYAQSHKSAQEVAMSSIGSLRVYEMMLGLCFITIVLNWILIN